MRSGSEPEFKRRSRCEDFSAGNMFLLMSAASASAVAAIDKIAAFSANSKVGEAYTDMAKWLFAISSFGFLVQATGLYISAVAPKKFSLFHRDRSLGPLDEEAPAQDNAYSIG